MMIRAVSWTFVCGWLLSGYVSATTPAFAGGRDFTVSTTRLGGDPESAQPYIDKFAGHLEKLANFPKGSLKGVFAPSRKEALTDINARKPGFGVLDPWLYFDLRAAQNLEAIAEVRSAELNSAHFYVVVKDPGWKTLDDLQGKRLWTHLAEYPQYLSRVVLDGKGAAETRFALKQVGNVMKAVRAVLHGEADAAIVDESQLEAAKKLDGGAALRVLYASTPQPPAVLVVFNGNVAPADKQPLAKAVLTLCGTKEGGEICAEMHISRFVELDKTLFSAAQKRYEATGGTTK